MSLLETIILELQGSNIALFGVLILLFVVGYKILQVVVQIGIVAVLSGVFFTALSVLGVGPAFTINRFIQFMVLGTGLFITYSTIATAIKTADSVLEALVELVKWATDWDTTPNYKKENKRLHKQLERLKNARKTAQGKVQARRSRGSNEEEPKEKEIILHEFDDED